MELTYTLDQLDDVAQQIIDNCQYHNLLFYGEMGTGKTTLVKALVKVLGSEDVVSSPTFSIVNEYKDGKNSPIYHFDFYRIEHESEVEQLGLEEYYDTASWTFIEWPQNINNFLPQPVHTANIKSLNNYKRILTFK